MLLVCLRDFARGFRLGHHWYFNPLGICSTLWVFVEVWRCFLSARLISGLCHISETVRFPVNNSEKKATFIQQWTCVNYDGRRLAIPFGVENVSVTISLRHLYRKHSLLAVSSADGGDAFQDVIFRTVRRRCLRNTYRCAVSAPGLWKEDSENPQGNLSTSILLF